MYDWHQVHFMDELEISGHTVVDCNPIRVLGRPGTPGEYSEVLLDYAKRVAAEPGPHMLLAATAKDTNLEPGVLADIKRLGMATVNLNVDGVMALDTVKHTSPHFDLHWTTYYGTEKKLAGYGCKVICLPMAANPYFFRADHSARNHAICFVGSKTGARSLYIAQLGSAGIPLWIAGNGWLSAQTSVQHNGSHHSPSQAFDLSTVTRFLQFSAGRKVILGAIKKRFSKSGNGSLDSLSSVTVRGPLSLRDMANTYARHTASLGVLEVANTHLLKSPVVLYRLREFEATMLGCLHIVRRTPELEDCFTEDQEIVFYDTVDECVEKARYYLDPARYDAACCIGRQARRRAEREHTWLRRFEAVWKELGI